MNDIEALQVTRPTERQILLTRVFDASRERVFEASTECESLKQWYGSRGGTMAVCEIDFRVGGAWRAVALTADGEEVRQHGVYREIVPPERFVSSAVWEGWHPGELLVTTVFTEEDGKTTLRCTVEFPSQEVRDELEAGLERGSAESYGKLAEFLSTESREA